MANLVIRQFDVFHNPDARRHPAVPYLLVLQSHLLPDMATWIVAPLRRPAQAEGVTEIQAPVEVEGEAYILMAAELAHTPAKLLQRPIADLTHYEDDIRRALSRLFTGF